MDAKYAQGKFSMAIVQEIPTGGPLWISPLRKTSMCGCLTLAMPGAMVSKF
jgi:hypothetical protein